MPDDAGGAQQDVGQNTDANQDANKQVDSNANSGFVTAQQFEAFQNRIEGAVAQAVNGLTQRFDAVAAGGRQQPQQQEEPKPVELVKITQAEYDTALENGELPELINRVTAENARRIAADEIARRVEPRFAVNDRNGAATTRAIALQNAEYYPEYKREVDAAISQLAPSLQADPDNIKAVYNLVIAGHMNEIINKKVEAAMRRPQQGEGNNSPTPGGQNAGRTGQQQPDSSPVTLFGEESDLAVRTRGRTWDEQAKKMGYRDYADMVNQTEPATTGASNNHQGGN